MEGRTVAQFPGRGVKKWIPLAIWKIPHRLLALILQLFWPVIALIRWIFGKSKSNWNWKGVGYSTLKWPVRLGMNVLDFLAIGEIVDGLAILFYPRARKLTQLEYEEAKSVFGEDFPFWRVRILEDSNWAKRWARKWQGAGLAFVVSRVIRFSREINPHPGNRDMQWLMHELVHVAQLESIGLQYLPEALYAQRTGGYDYGGPSNLQGKRLWNFNREQQARIVEDYYALSKAGKGIASQYLPYIKDLRSGLFIK